MRRWPAFLPPAIRRFRKRYPETRLEVRIFDSSDLLRAVERGDYHVGLMRPPTNANLLRFRPLISERFVAIIPRRSALVIKPVLRLADFVGHDVITFKRFGILSFRAVYNQIIDVGIDPYSGVTASTRSAAMVLASAGQGIAFLPEWVGAIADKEVVLRQVEDLTHEISLGIGWLADCPAPGSSRSLNALKASHAPRKSRFN